MKPPSLEHPKRCDAKYFSFHSNPSTPSTYKQVPNFQSNSWRLGGGKRRRISQPLQAARLSLQLATEPAFHNYVNRSHRAVTAEQHFPPSERLKGQRSAGFEAQRSACDCRPTAGSGGPRRPRCSSGHRVFRFGFFRSSRRNAAALPAAQRGFPVQPLPSPGRSRPRAARTLRARLWAHPEAAQRRAGRSAAPGGTAARGFRRSGLTSSLTRGCSLPRSWAQGRRCRLWSWPRTSSGRLCGSASPAFAWNSSCTFAIFLPAARPARTAPPRRPAPAARGGAARRPPGGRTGHGRRAALRGPDVRGASRRGAAPSSGGRERDGTWRERAGCEERCWAPPSRCLSPCHAAPRPPGCTGNLCFPLIVPLRDGNGVKL